MTAEPLGHRLLPKTDLTVEDARRILSGLHFAQETLSPEHRDLLHLAEGLLRLVEGQAGEMEHGPSRLTRQVTQLHQRLGAHINYGPPSADIPEDLRDIRAELLREEFEDEYLPAVAEGDLVKIGDALGDMACVISGTALTYGIPLDPVTDEIHRSNMTKEPSPGKFIKGPGYTPPNIAGIIDPRGYRA